MRFLVLIKIEENSGNVPDERLLTEMGKLIAEMKKAGVLVETDGLRPTSEGARIRLDKGKTKLMDGPFSESKEVVGGFFMLETASQEEALEWMRRFLVTHGTEWTVECEVRQLGGYS
ncbi:YciI family protein [Dyella tabacisoli]|uniref:Transcriptional regulator n=1 Tax=Dyella tabacisoli TaxID=2282381 RepID=A0A369UP52_9GAMM|nr:YciI family protein [Dyella tabacisoli]RDD81498.1 transcriptional regulator [Dyella tabacisoli]